MLMAMLLLAAGTPVASAAASPAPEAVVVPAEIDQHYRDYNFVNSFSTRSERTMIAAGRAPSEPRLGRIARAMGRIAARIEDIDPGLVADGNVSPETALRSDLVRIESWRTNKEGSEGWVTLDVSTLERGPDVLFVGKLEDRARGEGEAAAALDRILRAAPVRPAFHTTEVHHWIRIDGTWRRDAATLHFLAN
jgi:hypothetical protein